MQRTRFDAFHIHPVMSHQLHHFHQCTGLMLYCKQQAEPVSVLPGRFGYNDKTCRVLHGCIDILGKHLQSVKLRCLERSDRRLALILFFCYIFRGKSGIAVWNKFKSSSLQKQSRLCKPLRM